MKAIQWEKKILSTASVESMSYLKTTTQQNIDPCLTLCSFPWGSASLGVQLVKDVSAMLETWVQSLGWEDPLETGKATHSSILVWNILRTV